MINKTKIKGSLIVAAYSCFILVGCSQEETEEVVNLPETALVPKMGGLVQQLGNYAVELLPTPDGRLQAQLRDEQGIPVIPEGATLLAEIEEEGEPRVITLFNVEEEPRYTGVVPGITGKRPVKVILASSDHQSPDIETSFPEVELTTTDVDVVPWHNGRIAFFGENRVELATTAEGAVTLSVTDLDGRPVPPESVELEQVSIFTEDGPQIVALQPQGAVFVGRLESAPPQSFQASLNVGIRGRQFADVRVLHGHPLPQGVVVEVDQRSAAPVAVSSRFENSPAQPMIDFSVEHQAGRSKVSVRGPRVEEGYWARRRRERQARRLQRQRRRERRRAERRVQKRTER